MKRYQIVVRAMPEGDNKQVEEVVTTDEKLICRAVLGEFGGEGRRIW